MSRYVLTDAAKSDLRSLDAYVRRHSSDAADRLAQHLRDAFRLVAKSPLIGRERPDVASHLRSFPVRNYVLYYRVESREITIMRVLHGAMDAPAAFGEE